MMTTAERRAKLRAGVLVAALVAFGACRSGTNTVLVVTVTVSGSLTGVSSLDVTLVGPSGPSERQYGGGAAIAFPTTFTAQLPPSITGNLRVDVKAMGTGGVALAQGRTLDFPLRPGERHNVLVQLDCGGPCPNGPTDGGVGPPPGDAQTANPSCGNGHIDQGETCDTAIAAGTPGTCPRADCDDGVPCTTDRHMELRAADPCSAVCVHEEVKKTPGAVKATAARDKCCPAGATPDDDPDCLASCGNGAVDVGEACDTAILAGQPGACPVPTGGTGAHCDDRDPCTKELLVGAGTCSATCVHLPVTTQSGPMRDGCCPAGAWHEVDLDCPASCGDGVVQAADGEMCDLGIPFDTPGGCPHTCDDGVSCTLDVLKGAGCAAYCEHTKITALVSGDGCCPEGANRRTDRDCAPTCPNKVVEPGESCDTGAVGAGACPTSCPPSPSACLESKLVGTPADCTVRCVLERVDVCRRASDGCCADGCTAANDPDCSGTCGDGVIQAANGETCDTAIAAGSPGACPKTCSDGVACTRDVLVAANTCMATCLYLPITEPLAGDGCCPPGGDANLDPDCAPVCGNGVAESPGETCDYAVGMGACPGTCGGGDEASCTRVRPVGKAASCTAACVAQVITTCVSGDKCCPSWCTIANDSDCPAICGDGIKSPLEVCDRAITAGLPGACPHTCDDGDACTFDVASGALGACTAACSHARVTACANDDGCCPPGCSAAADRDCAPSCGDGRLGAGETCDPPAACPVSCPDDGDPCTLDVLAGDPNRCDAVCRHVPVTTCSGKAADLCCPTGCGPDKDVDCPAWGPQ